MIRFLCTERRTVRNLTNTGMDISAKIVVCARCGIGYARYKGNFPVSYAPSYKGIGYIPICRNCVDKMYAEYMRETDDPKAVMHQICRKLDIYWNEHLFDSVAAKASNRSVTSVYLQRVAAINYAGKSYDDTLRESGGVLMESLRRTSNQRQCIRKSRMRQKRNRSTRSLSTFGDVGMIERSTMILTVGTKSGRAGWAIYQTYRKRSTNRCA